MTGRFRSTLGMALCAALLASGVWAQSKTTAALTGTVTDDSGAAIPGASVEVSSPALIGGSSHRDVRRRRPLPVPGGGARNLRRGGVTRGFPDGAGRGHHAGHRLNPGHRGEARCRRLLRNDRGDPGRRYCRHRELRDQHQPRQRLSPEPADRPLPARRPESRSRNQQRCRLRFRRIRTRLSARRGRHFGPGGRYGLVVRQLQHRRRGPAGRPRGTGRVRQLHRRGLQQRDQVGRQRVTRVSSTPTTRTRACPTASAARSSRA